MSSYTELLSSVLITHVFVTLCGARASGTAFMFEVSDNRRFCLMEMFDGPKRYVLNYKVVRGGNQDIDASIKSPNGKLLYRQLRSKEDDVTFETSRGEYTFCFGNEFSTISHKYVHFDLRPEELGSLADESGVKKPFVKGSAETSCDNIHEHMTSVVSVQRDYRLKESFGHHLAKELRSKVSWWSIGQGCVLFLVGFGQVFIMKRFFTESDLELIIPA